MLTIYRSVLRRLPLRFLGPSDAAVLAPGSGGIQGGVKTGATVVPPKLGGTGGRGKPFLCTLFLILLIVGLFALPGLARPTPQELVQQGDKLWAEDSYTLAQESYQKALAADPNLPGRPELELRIAIALIRAQEWDRAVAATEAFVKKYPETPLEARGQVWRGRLYVQIVHTGYQVGDKITRGSNVPKSEGGLAPKQVDLTAQDAQQAVAAFTRAKTLFERFRRAKGDPAERAALIRDEIELDFDLANLYASQYDLNRYDTQTVDWKIDPTLPFDPHWPAPRQVMTLYAEIPALDAMRPDTDHHATVLAAFGEATYILQLRQWHQWYFPYYQVYDDFGGRRGRSRFPTYRSRHIFLPYLEIDPIRLLQDTLDRYPHDRDADRLAFTIAQWTEQQGDTLAAANLYGEFLAHYPQSRWASDAKSHLDTLFRSSLGFSIYDVMSRPGQRAKVQINTRNLAQVRFTAYRIHPEEIFGHIEYKEDNAVCRPTFSNFTRNFDPRQAALPYRREKVAEWTATTSNNGKHNLCYDTVTTPLDAPGAYLVEARAGEHDELGAETVAIVSDMTLVEKVDRDSLLVYAADADTGKPLPNVKLTIWAPTRYQSPNQEQDALYLPGETGSEGAFRRTLPMPADLASDVPYTERRAQVFAYAGGNRYAVTNQANLYNGINPLGENRYHAFVQTDRPLYRPNQTVYFRLFLTEGTPGKYEPAVMKSARLLITGPRGQLLDKAITADPSGAVNDSLTLPPAADLGEYQIRVRSPEGVNYEADYGTGTFRVEEYKKPEFAVTVQPEKTSVRVGETLKVAIGARYFFGAPVVGAKVHYRVFRSPFFLPSPFRSRPEWFESVGYYPGYNGSSPGNVDVSARGDTNVAYREGDVTTDANGTALVAVPTDPPKGFRGARSVYPDQNFVITADVVDDSRREVIGAGTASALAAQFRAAMRLDRNFVLPGDPLRIEVNTRDGSQKPVSADGEIKLVRLIPAIPEQRGIDPKTGKEIILVRYVPPREEPAGTLGVHTDAAQEGNGVAYWRPDTSGDYRLDYQAKDAWGNLVTASSAILVYGPGFDARLNKDDQRFDLSAEFANYRRGETARVLIVTPAPDSYVLFTEQAIGAIVRYRTVFVPGRSALINVPITLDHVPNTFLTATLIRSGQVREVQTEIGVPEEEKILALKVTPDKPTYKPGERATFTLHAADANGKPVRGAISLAVVDKSLLALQPDLTPDIRTYFYGYRIQTYLGGADSVNFNPGSSGFEPPQISYEQHNLVYPEGMGWLRDHANGGNPAPVPVFIVYVPPPAKDSPFPMGGVNTGFNVYARGGFGGRGAMGGPGGGFGGGGFGPQGDAGPAGPQGPPAPADLAYAYGDTLSLNGRRRDIFQNEMAKAADTVSQTPAPATPPSSGPLVEATVRRLFADTAYWAPAVLTDADGNATVSFDFPDNITQWQVMARGITGAIQVGLADAEAVTKKNLLVRLQAPRFFVDRDQVTISANIHNYLDRDKTARVELVLDGARLDLTPQPPSLPARSSLGKGVTGVSADAPGRDTINPDGKSGLPVNRKESVTPFPVSAANALGKASRLSWGLGNTAVRQITLAKDGEARVDWTVHVQQAGQTKIKVIAQTDQESDAAEMEFPVLVHGVEKFLAQSGVLHDGGEANWTFDLPQLRRQGATLLDVQMSPSLASIMLDALPYLEDYPYGCVEQTLSRFVPSVLVAKTLRDSGIDLETLGKRAKALEEARQNIPPQQVYADSGYTYPKGVPGALNAPEMARRLALSYHARSSAPIFDSTALKAMVDAGLQRLYEMQRSDGSWGWWQGSPLGDPYLTAYIVEGLIHAQQADVAVRPGVIESGYAYLRNHLDSTEDLHLLAYYVYVLSLRAPNPDAEPGRKMAEEFLYARRDRINAYGQALLALALHGYGDDEKARVLVRNLVNLAKRDRERGTVHWESEDNRDYWRWYNDKQETTAMVLRALAAIAPQEQVTPQNGLQGEQTGLAPGAVRWLVDNRRGGYWTSTRQTAQVVEALLEYARAQKELMPDYTVTVDVDGKVQKSYHITRDNALFFDNRFLVGDEILASGGQKLHITMQGTGTLYWNAYLKYFDMEEPIKGVANAIGVERHYYKLVSTVKKDKQGQFVTSTERVPLADGAALISGDIIEVELDLKSDNDYDYMVFEDMKPAGCEATETRSGTAYGDGLCSNFELRDEKVVFFVDTLPQGTRRITYRLRAEIPGAFHALPTNAYAMYTPDIRALSDEWRVSITDPPPPMGKR